MRAKRPDARAIFLHVPKAAGTTLQTIIERHYRPSEVFFAGTVVHEALAELRRADVEVRAGIRFATGHMAYGVHDDLPGPSSYFTVLRDPVDRVVSFYYFVRQNSFHYLHDFSTAAGRDLEGFMEGRPSIMVDNAQTRLIAGIWDDVPFGQLGPEALELAKRRLRERFDVVGLSERFDETLLMLGRWYGWRHLYSARQNVTGARRATRELSDSERRAVARHNRLDQQLYDYAATLFERQVRREGPSFSERVRRFQAMNRRVGPAYGLGWRALLKSRRVLAGERRLGQAHGQSSVRG
jgi:hypothetical protein